MQLFEALNCTNEETMKKSIATIEKVFHEYKANAASNIKFKGVSPGVGSKMPDSGAPGDSELRKAMGLRT